MIYNVLFLRILIIVGGVGFLFSCSAYQKNLYAISGTYVSDEGLKVYLGYQQYSYSCYMGLSGLYQSEGVIYQKRDKIILQEYDCKINLRSDTLIITDDVLLGDSTRIVLKDKDDVLSAFGFVRNGSQVGNYGSLYLNITFKLDLNKKIEVKYPGYKNFYLLPLEEYKGKEISIKLFNEDNTANLDRLINSFRVTKEGLVDDDGILYKRLEM